YGVPVFNGVAFLTGMGQKQELEKIISFVKG
ncbi:PTS galactitol transporter subunit IIB, partial [Streptococcus agalactiae]